MSHDAHDVAIIGGGHNGLTCAAYLAGAGLRVIVLEKNAVVGGAAVTEEFHPGFRNSVAAYTVSLLNPVVIRDLELVRHGLRIVERPVANFWPVDERRGLLMPYGLGLADKRLLMDLFTKSAADFLSDWFESEVVKGAFAFDSIVGAYASPRTPGTAYVLLHHCFGEVNGKPGVWGHAVGGMGAISQAMTRAAQARGAVVRTDAPVASLIVEGGRACGVRLESGERIAARAVAANVPPKLLFRDLVPLEAVDPDLLRRFTRLKSGSGTFRMNVALSELPDFRCRPGVQQQDHHGSGIVIGPTIDYLDRAYLDARRHGWSREPVIEMLIPSTLDDTLAPAGRHVASLFVQHVAPQLPDGRSWDDAKEEFADLVIDTVGRHAPNFRASIIARQVLSPMDLERRFGLVDGDIFHGQLTLDQLYSVRPVLGHADYRIPVPALYLCGAGAHPGGGVTGLPGRNAAIEIIRDFKRPIWLGNR